MTIAQRGRTARPRVAAGVIEQLETRQLLTSTGYAFAPPDLTPFLHQANPAPAIYNRMVGSLQAQLNDGPLNDLKAKTINEGTFVAAVADVVAGFESAGAAALQKYPVYGELIQLQGNALDTETVLVGALYDSGIVDAFGGPVVSDPVVPNQTNIEHLTLSRPLWPVGTPILNIINRTESLQSDLGTILANVPAKITLDTATHLADLEADAFTADILLSSVHQTDFRNVMLGEVQTLRQGIDAAADPAAFHDAVQTFTTATYDRQTGEGYLGPHGAYGSQFPQPTNGSQTADLIPSYSDANTFALGRYKAVRTPRDTVYHRNYGGQVSRFGRYVTTTLYQNSQQAIRLSALDQTFPQKNNAFYVTDVAVPSGLLRYVGRVAPIYQGVLTPRNSLYPGMGVQVLLSSSRAPGVKFQNQRTTGT